MSEFNQFFLKNSRIKFNISETIRALTEKIFLFIICTEKLF